MYISSPLIVRYVLIFKEPESTSHRNDFVLKNLRTKYVITNCRIRASALESNINTWVKRWLTTPEPALHLDKDFWDEGIPFIIKTIITRVLTLTLTEEGGSPNVSFNRPKPQTFASFRKCCCISRRQGCLQLDTCGCWFQDEVIGCNFCNCVVLSFCTRWGFSSYRWV